MGLRLSAYNPIRMPLLRLGKGHCLIANRADRVLGAGRSGVHGEDGDGANIDAADRRGDVCGNANVGVVEDVDVANRDVHEPVLPRVVLSSSRPSNAGAKDRSCE